MGRKVWVPVVSGPLAPYAAGFASWLASRAYSPWAAADRLYQFDQLSRWVEREGLGVGELTGEQAERFAEVRRAGGLVSWASQQSVALPLGYLRQLGTAPTPASVCPECPLEELLADYRRYLSIERGLSDHTVLDAYGPAARLFLSGWESSNGLGLEFGFATPGAVDTKYMEMVGAGYQSYLGVRDLFGARYALIVDPDGNQIGLRYPLSS